MNRRDLIKTGVIATVAGSLSENVWAAETKSSTLTDALAKCLQTGEACIAHCMSELSKGNKELGECDLKVHEMLAMCNSLMKLASYKSDLLKPMANLCAKACDSCAEACNKHSAHFVKGMHLACKDCLDACRECSKQCKQVA